MLWTQRLHKTKSEVLCVIIVHSITHALRTVVALPQGKFYPLKVIIIYIWSLSLYSLLRSGLLLRGLEVLLHTYMYIKAHIVEVSQSSRGSVIFLLIVSNLLNTVKLFYSLVRLKSVRNTNTMNTDQQKNQHC